MKEEDLLDINKIVVNQMSNKNEAIINDIERIKHKS
jgi:hypothetical protein